jgi:hypothetical protein
MQYNNILSYFIKDIKDAKELALYKQTYYNNYKTIWYKNEIICKINTIHIYNYIFNIYKSSFINIKSNYKISSFSNSKNLYYKHDKTLRYGSLNYIYYMFIYKKYLVKTKFRYVSNVLLLDTILKYHNKYKYIFKYDNLILYKRNNKYTNNIILIMNKYELHYYNKFFNLYFGL